MGHASVALAWKKPSLLSSCRATALTGQMLAPAKPARFEYALMHPLSMARDVLFFWLAFALIFLITNFRSLFLFDSLPFRGFAVLSSMHLMRFNPSLSKRPQLWRPKRLVSLTVALYFSGKKCPQFSRRRHVGPLPSTYPSEI